MASTQQTADFIVDQMAAAGVVRSRKMFGEYAVYCDDKVVAFNCDDQLFVKQKDAACSFLGDIAEGAPYPGAKLHFLIDENRWDDAAFMAQLAQITADELPAPQRKR